jgi:hypothetical protein
MPWVTGDAAISKRAVANFTLDFFVCVVLICGLCPCRFGIFLLALARIGLIGPQAFCHTTPLQNRTLQVVILMFVSRPEGTLSQSVRPHIWCLDHIITRTVLHVY